MVLTVDGNAQFAEGFDPGLQPADRGPEEDELLARLVAGGEGGPEAGGDPRPRFGPGGGERLLQPPGLIAQPLPFLFELSFVFFQFGGCCDKPAPKSYLRTQRPFSFWIQSPFPAIRPIRIARSRPTENRSVPVFSAT